MNTTIDSTIAHDAFFPAYIDTAMDLVTVLNAFFPTCIARLTADYYDALEFAIKALHAAGCATLRFKQNNGSSLRDDTWHRHTLELTEWPNGYIHKCYLFNGMMDSRDRERRKLVHVPTFVRTGQGTFAQYLRNMIARVG
jgi:hypothetical protein